MVGEFGKKDDATNREEKRLSIGEAYSYVELGRMMALATLLALTLVTSNICSTSDDGEVDASNKEHNIQLIADN